MTPVSWPPPRTGVPPGSGVGLGAPSLGQHGPEVSSMSLTYSPSFRSCLLLIPEWSYSATGGQKP